MCTANPEKADKRTRSKWSRVMRYAVVYKADSEPLGQFIRRKGGINECAARFSRYLGRPKAGPRDGQGERDRCHQFGTRYTKDSARSSPSWLARLLPVERSPSRTPVSEYTQSRQYGLAAVLWSRSVIFDTIPTLGVPCDQAA